jgi:hypothetical protein
MDRTFLISWDNTGIEYVADITEKMSQAEQYEKEKLFALLQDREPTNPAMRELGQLISMLMMRARVNTHRHYEIYTMQVAPGITEKDVREMFETDPQYSADLIRERGNKLHSDRARQSEIKIV